MKRNPLLLALAFLAAVAAPAATLYVDAGSTNPIAPYTNWPTAAAVTQDAVDAAQPGDTVLVTDGIYATGGRAVPYSYGLMSNRVTVDRTITLRSVNGPEGTIIKGYQVPGTTNGDGAVRCVFLAGGATLGGFTITNGATRTAQSEEDWLGEEVLAGGIWCEPDHISISSAVVSNCVIVGNSAFEGAAGVMRGTMKNCVLQNNTGFDEGGGAHSATLINCTLIGNVSTLNGGGAANCNLTNCTFIGNSAFAGGAVSECDVGREALGGPSMRMTRVL